MSVTTGGVSPFTRLTPISNITPFTYRDGITYLEILECIRAYIETELPEGLAGETNRIVEQFNATVTALDATLAVSESDAAAAFDAFTTENSGIVEMINNRTGPQDIHRVTLAADTTLTINPGWPTAHPIMVQVTQDTNGGHTLALEARITGDVDVDPNPDVTTSFYLVPLGNDVWHASQYEPLLPVADVDTFLNGARRFVEIDKAYVGLPNVDNTADADKPVSGPMEERLRHRLYSKWDKPLDRWAEALANIDTRPVIWINCGSSTANGGVVERSTQSWFNRICYMLGKQNGNEAFSNVTSADVPANGFYGIKAAVGGTTSANYLSTADIAKINSFAPTVVSHMIGSNDWSGNVPLDTYKGNLRNKIQAIRNANANTTQLLIHQQGRLDGTRALPWSAYGNAMREVAEEFPDTCVFLDMDQHFRFMGIPNGNTWGFVVSDNLHLNGAGNQVFADIVSEFMGIPTSRTLGEEVYQATVFNGGSMLTADNGKVISEIAIPPKPYPRNLVATASLFAHAVNGHNDIQMAAGSFAVGRTVAVRVSNATPQPTTWSGRWVVEPFQTGSIKLLAQTLTSAELVVTSNNAYASFIAELKPGF